MKSFEFTSLHFPVVHLFLILSALVGLSAAQQNAGPILDKTGTFAISFGDNFVTVRNTRTGGLLSVEPVGAPAPGTPPLPATDYQFQTLTAPVGGVQCLCPRHQEQRHANCGGMLLPLRQEFLRLGV
jgi:hypothetical protein